MFTVGDHTPRPTTDRARPTTTDAVTAPAGSRALVRDARPPRPAVARDARPLGRARLRGDAPPDPGAARRAGVAGVHRPLPDAGGRPPPPGPGAVIAAWGRLGYPRRARWLWERRVDIAARRLARRPRASCPASAATPRPRSPPRPTTPTRRHRGEHPARLRARRRARLLAEREAEARRGRARAAAARPRSAARADGPRRDRVHRPRTRVCARARSARRARRAARSPARRDHRQAAFAGSFRQRRGRVMARLRAGRRRGRASSTPRRSRRSSTTGSPRSRAGRAHLPTASRTEREEVAQEVVAGVGEDRLGVELHAFDREARGGAAPSPGRRRSRR